MKRSRLRKSIWAAALVVSVAGALALGACGGSSTTASSTTAASTPSAAATTALPQAVITDYPATPLPTPTVAGTIAYTKTLHLGDAPNLDIYVVNTDGSGLKRLTDANGMEEHPSWSPDGRKIAYAQWRPGTTTATIWVMNADGSHKVQLTKGAVHGDCPAWSPDGKHIAFWRQVPDGESIYVMNADGSGVKPVAGGISVWEGYPEGSQTGGGMEWAPDGRLLFRSSGEVDAVNLDGSGRETLTTGADLGTFALSPDSATFVLEDSIGQLQVVPASGGGTSLTLAQSVSFLIPDPWTVPSWSPDGKVMAISSSTLFGCQGSPLCIINADGTGLSAVPGVEKANDAAWRPQ